MSENQENPSSDAREKLNEEIEDALKGGVGPKAARFALACLSGIPYVGGALGGVAAAWSEAEQAHLNRLFAAWLKLQEQEIREIGITMMEVATRVDLNDPKTRERMESPEYLGIVKKAFRDWSAAESEEKRHLVRNLLCNAASSDICSDAVVRLFVDWLGKYSEAHFAVIREIFKNPGSTRYEIWMDLHGKDVKENSAEADFFKLLIHDLSTGRIVRQHRETDAQGNFIRKRLRKSRFPTRTMKSAFDDEEDYELTELGKQFVHYTMNEVVPKLGAPSGPTPTPPAPAAP